MPVTKPGYFPILDCLRFLASVCVFLAHSVVFFDLPVTGLYFNDFIKDAGYFGVIFFYTLSGFLITYLLLKEKRDTSTIAIKDFYIRRALRIWPLYYLIVFLSFFVFPYLVQGHLTGSIEDRKGPFLLYLLFLPNVAALRGFYFSTCFHTYTIGYEEQFYLFWPLVLRKAGQYFAIVLIGLFFLPPALEIIHLRIVAHGLPLPDKIAHGVRSILSFINYSNMPAFIAGAMAAFCYLAGGEKVLTLAGKKIWGWLLTAATLGLMYFTKPGGLGYVNGISLIFAFLILHMVLSKDGAGKTGAVPSLRRSMGGLLAKGGKISYGIYIFHPTAFIFVSYCMNKGHIVFVSSSLLTYLVFLVFSFALLLLMAAVSFRYFEQYFLRKKINYQDNLLRRTGRLKKSR